MKSRLLTVFLGPFVPTAVPTAARAQDTTYAFVHVAVIPMGTERVLQDRTVVIKGDRISVLSTG